MTDAAETVLEELTGHGSVYWIAAVQAELGRAGDWIHPECDVPKWVGELAELVDAAIARRKPNRDEYDENMAAATALALILARWAVRIQRAKAYDPNRPVRLRLKGLGAALDKSMAITAAAYLPAEPDLLDREYFPGQAWENPNRADATDGTFTI